MTADINGYDIDALLEGAGPGASAFSRYHVVYMAISNALNLEKLLPEEKWLLHAQEFLSLLNFQGFSRYFSADCVGEFLDALDAFEAMPVPALGEFCTVARQIIGQEDLIEADDHDEETDDTEEEDIYEPAIKRLEEFLPLLQSLPVERQILDYVIQISPKLRFRAEAQRLWIYEEKENGRGGHARVIENPRGAKP